MKNLINVFERQILTILLLATAICAFASEPTVGMRPTDYPMCDGSRTSESIQRMLACKMFGIPYCWDTKPGSNRSILYANPCKPYGDYTDDDIREIALHTQSWGSYDATHKLLNHEIDLAFLTCETKERFDSLSVKYGVEVHEETIGMDGVAVLVNGKNTVKSLTIDQLQAIFSGEVTNWKDVGGNDCDIMLYLPSIGSCGRDVFTDVVMCGKPFAPNKHFYINEVNTAPYNDIDLDEGAITFSWSSFYHVSVIKKQCHPVAIEGVEPTQQTVKDESYPLRAPVKIVTRVSHNLAPTTWDVINYALSPAGQDAVEECGYAAIGKTKLTDAAHGRAQIEINGAPIMLDKDGQVAAIHVYTIDGRLLRHAEAGDNGVRISGIPPGAYIITATFADGQSCSQKAFCL